MVKKKQDVSKVISFVLMIAFGLLAVIIGYATFKGGSFEFRSKAASEEITLKEWLFEKNTDGWVAKDFGKSFVKNGMYTLVIGPTPSMKTNKGVERLLNPRIENGSVNTLLNYPINRLKISLSIVPQQLASTCVLPPPCAFLRRPCAYIQEGVAYCPLSGGGGSDVFEPVVQISFRLEGKKKFENTVSVPIIADGAVHDISIEIPKAMMLHRVDELVISFSNVRKSAHTRIDIADMRIVGLKEIFPVTTKAHPDPVQSFTGMVTKVPNDRTDMSPYILQVQSSISEPVVEYRLVQAKEDGECKYMALCALIVKRPEEIDFKQYVGKYVTVTGTVVKSSPQKDYDVLLPTLYVSSIRLAQIEPTTSGTPECYQPVKCVRAPCEIRVCPTRGDWRYLGPPVTEE